MKSKFLKQACLASSVIALAAVMSTSAMAENHKGPGLPMIVEEYVPGPVPFCDILNFVGDAGEEDEEFVEMVLGGPVPGSLGQMFNLAVDGAEIGAAKGLPGLYRDYCENNVSATAAQ